MRTLVLLLLLSLPARGQAGPPSNPFLDGSLDQAARLAPGMDPIRDPAEDGVLAALKARMDAWTEGLPGASGAGITERSSEAAREARTRRRAEGLVEALGGRLTEALVDQAVLRRSRSVRAADRATKAAVRRYPQTAHLDNLVVQYQDLASSRRPAAGTNPAPMGREGRSGDGTLAIQGEITTLEVEIASVDAGLARRRAVTGGRRALARYAWAREAAAAIRDLEAVVKPLREVLRLRLATGKASQGEFLRLEVLLEDLETRRHNLEDEAAGARADLAGILDLPSGAALGTPVGAAVPGDVPETAALVRRALSRRHEVTRLRLELRKLDRIIALQKARALPDLATGMSDLANPLARDGVGAFPARPVIPMDVFLGGREAWLDELVERRHALEERRRDVEARLRGEVEAARHALSRHRRTWRVHSGEMLERSRQRVALERAGYQQGTRSFQDVMDAEEQYIRHRLEGIDALRDARLAWATLRDAAMLVDSPGDQAVPTDHPGG